MMSPEWFFSRSHSFDPFSITTKRITVLSNSVSLSHATAFFYNHNSKTYLISNWHVFSGRNRYTGKCMDPNRREPTELRFFTSNSAGSKIEFLPYSSPTVSNQSENLEFNVPLKDSDGANLWVQHSVHGQKIDIAAIELGYELLSKILYLPANAITNQIGELSVGNQLFIVGHIDDIDTENSSPIWKRANVATEPLSQVDNRPCFLVDAKTQEGMSGSPVFKRNELIANTITYNRVEQQVIHTEFVGVYSGRHKAKNIGEDFQDQKVKQHIQENYLDLGFVWPKKLIEEMLENPALGDYSVTQITGDS
jgi:hypothetical protein